MNDTDTLDDVKIIKNTEISPSDIYEWTDNIEDILKMWGEKAAGYRDLHLNNASYWNSISFRLSIPIIFLTTITSVYTFNAVNQDDYTYWMYTTGSVNLVAAFLSGMNKYLKPDSISMKHYQVGRAFGSFYRKILLELGIARCNRQSPSIFVEWAKNEYDRLVSEAPFLSQHIINDYIRSLNNNEDDVHKPDVLYNSNKINIHGR